MKIAFSVERRSYGHMFFIFISTLSTYPKVIKRKNEKEEIFFAWGLLSTPPAFTAGPADMAKLTDGLKHGYHPPTESQKQILFSILPFIQRELK